MYLFNIFIFTNITLFLLIEYQKKSKFIWMNMSNFIDSLPGEAGVVKLVEGYKNVQLSGLIEE